MSDPHDDIRVLSAQIEGVIRESNALNASLSQARVIRLLLFLVLVGFVLYVCWTYYDLGRKLIYDEKYHSLVIQEVQTTLEKDKDRYMKDVQKLMDEVMPTVRDSFTSRAQKDYPVVVQALDKERDNLQLSLSTQLDQKVDEHLQKMVKKHMDDVRKAFPTVADEKTHERVLANLQKAMKDLAQRYFVKEFNNKLLDLYATWDRIPQAERPAKGARENDDNEVLAAAINLLKIKLNAPPSAKP